MIYLSVDIRLQQQYDACNTRFGTGWRQSKAALAVPQRTGAGTPGCRKERRMQKSDTTGYLQCTPLLDFDTLAIQHLIHQRGWRNLPSVSDQIAGVYHFVKDEILYASCPDSQVPASTVLNQGSAGNLGKTMLLMALLPSSCLLLRSTTTKYSFCTTTGGFHLKGMPSTTRISQSFRQCFPTTAVVSTAMVLLS